MKGTQEGRDRDRRQSADQVEAHAHRRTIKSASSPLDRSIGLGRQARVETGRAAIADLGSASPRRGPPTLAEREALDRIDLSVDLAPERGLLLAEPDPRGLGHVRLRRRVRRGRRRPAHRRDLLQGDHAAAARRQPAAARDRDARAGCSTRSGCRTPAWTRSSTSTARSGRAGQVPVIVNVAGESIEDYVEVAQPARRRPGRGRHRAEHQLPQRRQGRAAVRDRPRRRPSRDRGRSPRHRPAAAGEALAQRVGRPADRQGDRGGGRGRHLRRSTRSRAWPCRRIGRGRSSATPTAGSPARP